MDDSVTRKQSAGSMELDLSSSQQTSQPAQDTSSCWATSTASAGMGAFGFTSAPPDMSIPSFDPAIAAFADMAFTPPLQAPSSSAFPAEKNTMTSLRPDSIQARYFHDKKRIKVEPDTSALDSIDYWVSFDDDLDKMGSFEIDYSKRPHPLGQSGPGIVCDSIPGLGSGLYSTSTAPFREEDFFDDSAFEQALSDDEEMLESTAKPGENTTQLENTSASQQAINNNGPLSIRSQDANRFEPGPRPRLEPAHKDVSKEMSQTYPQGPEPDVDEQRRFLEEALHSGRIPGALIPPNGFEIGFGAGMGCRPPQEFMNRPFSPSGKPAESQSTSRGTSKTQTGEVTDETASKQPTTKRPTTTRTGSSKKSTTGGASKPRSADRIAHNDVERKYRTNLKDRIAELRAAVPSLQASGGDGDSEGGSAGGQQNAAKISKEPDSVSVRPFCSIAHDPPES
ncbi:Helix-loop-helix DNA-binding domain protein [Metarhizium album ARSEF 1941]|uniref:Helix-loop-helix DNA-binding domain protein n=1 Tax=Metarhizium album (strain ARSEF 1941) TaxID=1081103 RepID=A0A0B2WSP7_METAS|nr:Helix-loop-helix DNA-binding domain protein [Metarhizium album ARSEF 1941]KHN99096.1 Helix-loop-helix DNA-binding domain protein [Metarhizium album ARSEF 1941]